MGKRVFNEIVNGVGNTPVVVFGGNKNVLNLCSKLLLDASKAEYLPSDYFEIDLSHFADSKYMNIATDMNELGKEMQNTRILVNGEEREIFWGVIGGNPGILYIRYSAFFLHFVSTQKK